MTEQTPPTGIDSAELQARWKRFQTELKQKIESEVAGIEAGQEAVRFYDQILAGLFEKAHSALARSGTRLRASLAAVGSYGRGAVALHSDLDVRLLYDGEPQQAKALIEALLYPLWDLRLALGHQVARLEELLELARRDTRTATTLLDWRHIAGDSDLTHQLQSRVFDAVFFPAGIVDFVESIHNDTVTRHDRYGASIYWLEPDIKLGAGGMRDLDVTLWATRARWKVQRIEDLVRVGVLVPREVSDITAARQHLWRVRNQLHLEARRRSDRLSFDQQERLAPLLGYGPGSEGAEKLMSAHYQHAQVITHAQELIVGRAMDRPRSRRPEEKDLGGGLRLFDGRLIFANAVILASEPSLAVRIYEEAVHRSVPIDSASRDTLRRALKMPSFVQALRQSTEARHCFGRLCATIQETKLRSDSVLGDMHDVGLLTALIPEFEPLVGRVHHDVYHVLTVDVHSIAALDKLRKLARGNLIQSFSTPSRLATEMARPQVLFLATLLHDVGKAIGRRDHSVRGAPIAHEVALRLGLSPQDAAEVEHLVRHHLVLYHIATRRDLEDPQVVQEVAQIVHGREGLRELYLLSFVDVSTTGPEAMTSWKAMLLEQLYFAVDAHLRGASVLSGDRNAAVQERISLLCSQPEEPEQLRRYLKSMPERYVLGMPTDRIDAHAKAVYAREPGRARVDVYEAHQGASAEVCVVTDDRPGLLAAISAVLAANRLSVLESQVYSRTREDSVVEAVDLFYVRSPGGETLSEPERLAAKLQADLQSIISGELSADDLVRPRIQALRVERHTPAVETAVVVDNRASLKLTVVEVFTRDCPGLLYVLARSFRDLRLSIRLAKINTEGTRVADVFYVCEADGSKVMSPGRIEEVRGRIQAALERPFEGS